MGLVFYLRNGRKRTQRAQRIKTYHSDSYRIIPSNIYPCLFLRFFVLLCGYPVGFKAKYLGLTQFGGC
jgi:hypothetical protein